MTRQEIWKETIGEFVSVEHWKSDSEAIIECPGSRFHSDGKTDAVYYCEHVPTISCFHSSCQSTVELTNQELRKECQRKEIEAGINRQWSLEEQLEWRQKRREKREASKKRRRIAEAARERLPIICEQYWRPLSAWIAESPHDGPRMPVRYQMEAWLASLPQDWRIWIGRTGRDSGGKWNCWNFATVDEWLHRRRQMGAFACPWQQVCPANFASWKLLCERKNAAVKERRLFVVEFDHLDDADPIANRELTLAVADWLRQECDMHLFSVTDSARRSVHCCFAWPEGGPAEWIKVGTVLDAMGADPGLWRLSATTRLPGGMRFADAEDDDLPVGWQRLIYLDPTALERGQGSSLQTHPEHEANISKMGAPDDEDLKL